jgi:hypothetical protein
MANKKINYSDPLPMETINEVLANAERVSHQLEQQQINKTNMTDNGTKIIINTQTNTDTSNTNTTDNIPTWKKLYKSFIAMMIVFMFVYTGMNILMWLYDTLGIEHVMPTLIGIVLWIVVYDHMYGTASKAPRI